MKKTAKKEKTLAKINPPLALPAPKTLLSLPTGRGAFTVGALIMLLVTLTSLAACALFYMKTIQAISYTAYAANQLQGVDRRMSDLQSKVAAYDSLQTVASGKIVSCGANAIAGDKNGDAQLLCTLGDGSQKAILASIRTAFAVKDGVYAPIVSAFLGSNSSTVYVVSGVKGNDTAYHLWTYDLTSGKTADLAGQ